MVAENRVEDMDGEGSCSLGMMLQCPVWDIVWARSLADIENPDDFVNLVRGG